MPFALEKPPRLHKWSIIRKRSLLTRGTVRSGTMPKAHSCSKRCSERPSSMPTAGRFRSVWSASSTSKDLGTIPSFAGWARRITPQAWMLRGNQSDELDAGFEAAWAPDGAFSAADSPSSAGSVRIEI